MAVRQNEYESGSANFSGSISDQIHREMPMLCLLLLIVHIESVLRAQHNSMFNHKFSVSVSTTSRTIKMRMSILSQMYDPTNITIWYIRIIDFVCSIIFHRIVQRILSAFFFFFLYRNSSPISLSFVAFIFLCWWLLRLAFMTVPQQSQSILECAIFVHLEK